MILDRAAMSAPEKLHVFTIPGRRRAVAAEIGFG